jgi:dipeptidyl aminopeptidase/acylaminoacyl peptidase
MRDASVVLSSDELMLAGDIYMPDDPCGSYPAVCLCHGIPAVKYNPEEKEGGYPELAARFCQAGFIALAFNFRGAGPSQGNIDMPGWTDDLSAAIDFLFMIPEVNKQKVCLLGSSGGAAACVYIAAKEKRVSAVATLACPAEFDFMATGHTVDSLIASFREIGIIKDPDFPKSREKWLEGFNTVKPLDYIDKISPRPLLLVHGDHDEVVPVKHARALFEKAGDPKELLILPGAGHRLRHDDRAVDAAMQWLKKQVM